MTDAARSHPAHLLVCALCIALGPWLTLATPAAAQNAQTVDVFVTVPHGSSPSVPDTPDAPSASPVEPLPRTGASARDLAVIAAALVALGTAVLTSTNSRKRASHA